MTGGSPASIDPLDELVALALERLEVEGEPGLERLCAEHPSRAATLRERIELLGGMGLLASVDVKPPEHLGEFRLGAQLGVGGMGIVYRATQEPLGREVALKVIRPEHMYFPGARSRFKREVEIVARLQHPGIVPIYTVGEAGGVPYFAMELLHGATLETSLKRLSERETASLDGRDLAPDALNPGYLFGGTWEEACLRVMRQVADAVDHAHLRGVIHRDIKPSNVLVTAGNTSRVVLLDFGLAAAPDIGKITRTGTQLGSISYMSPEQVRGQADRVGPRSDVYAMGVTLYELLTLRSPFAAPTETEVLLNIERGATRPVRELNARISWEAETVCLTAMELDPARRYASAADFARDLDNVLARRPIEARRVSALHRLRRWSERNPARAVAYFLGAALVVALPGVYAWQARRSSIAITAQRDRAERNFDRALQAVERMLSRVGSIDLRFMPRMEPVRRAVLEDAVTLLQQFVEDEASNQRAQREIAKAQVRLGDLFDQLGRNVEGVQAYERAAEVIAQLSEANPNDSALLDDLLTVRASQAALLTATGRGQEALDVYDVIEESAAEAARANPESLTARYRALANERGRAQALSTTARSSEALGAFRLAAEHADRLLDAHPQDGKVQELAQATWNSLGLYLIQRTSQGEANVEAIAALERSTELAQLRTTRAPGDPDAILHFADARNDLAGALRRAGENDRALDLYDDARNDLEALVVEYPETLNYKLLLATVSNQIGLLHDHRAEFVAAEPVYRRAVELMRELTAAAPEDASLWNHFGQSQANLATPVGMQGDLPGGMRLVEAAIEAQRKAIALAKDNAPYKTSFVEHCRMLAVMRREARDWRGALAVIESALEMTPDDARLWWGAMRVCVSNIESLRKDTRIDETERTQMIDEFVRRGVACLRGSIERGRPVQANLHEFKDPAPLHGTPEFEAYAAEWLAAKKD